MTQKELSYLEDAVNHEKSIISICNDISSNLEDQELVNFINNEVNNHTELLNNLMNLMEGKVNG